MAKLASRGWHCTVESYIFGLLVIFDAMSQPGCRYQLVLMFGHLDLFEGHTQAFGQMANLARLHGWGQSRFQIIQESKSEMYIHIWFYWQEKMHFIIMHFFCLCKRYIFLTCAKLIKFLLRAHSTALYACIEWYLAHLFIKLGRVQKIP